MDRKLIQKLGKYGQNLSAVPNEFAIANVIAELETKPAPEAYMGYALYDSDSNLFEQGKVVLSKKARNTHEELIEKIAIKKNGYLETFVVNETAQDVWFDNFRILSTGSLLVQETHYDPWGLELTGLGYQYGGINTNKYLYQGKEFLDDLNLNIYDFHARGYDPVIGRTLQLDPHADKYPTMSPYSWVANNPILMIDPDGKDFLIWYTDDKGKQQRFRFTGTNTDGAPKNEFVQQFVSAYNYNVENGGGDKMQEIAGNSKVLVNVAYTEYSSQHTPGGRPNVGNIYWNPMEGAQYENGTVVSPATVLEHESDHANQRITNYEQYRENTRSGREEVRVIEGSERKTARANREIPANGVTRTRHEGQGVITHGPKSNKINPQATQVHRQRLIERQKKSRDINW
jgi:RHS repeat-associated protein